MKTYEDLVEFIDNDEKKMEFVFEAITDHKQSESYKIAEDGFEYYRKRNTTILNYIKLLYTLSGEAVPDNFSANYKLCNNFFSTFVKQEVSHLLSNGVTFDDDEIKDRLGGSKLDIALMKLSKRAIWGGVAFGFYNLNHIDVFSLLEFVPLWGEEDGLLHAGIRFFKIDDNKPLRATLYEEDGYTEYRWYESKQEIIKPKTPYKSVINSTEADGDEIVMWQNYNGFPIIPLWANEEHQSELIGLQEKIDAFDLIMSGYCNDLDDCSQIFWSITNSGGMDDIDLARFVERMRTVKASVVDDEGSHAEAHTIEVPYQARTQLLTDLRDSIYRDGMALDVDKISSGNITATAIRASYENLTLKCDDFEVMLKEFFEGLFGLMGVQDSPRFKRSKIVNMTEETQMILQSAQYLDDETILRHLPFLAEDEIEGVLERSVKEEAGRFIDDTEETDGEQVE